MFGVLKKCFDVNLKDYENINIDLEINKIVAILFGVFMLWTIVFNSYRGKIRLVVMQLMRHKALDEDSAKTLGELGLDRSKKIKKHLSGDGILTKVVARVDAQEYSYEEYMALPKKERKKKKNIDFSSARFYIKEKHTNRAMNIVDKYVTSPLRTLLTCLFIAIISMCVIAIMPGILNIVNSMLENSKM